MRLVYLPSCRRDLLWLRHYYERVFPEGAAGARRRIAAAERVILDNPYIGRPTQHPGVRRLAIARTPFFVVYRVAAERIEVLRIIDSRSFDSMLDD
jgi:plasmid stabilization system protein ParE